MLRNIIWDVDGTLLNTYPDITLAFLNVLRAHGRWMHDEAVYDLARVGLSHCADMLSVITDLARDKIEQGFREVYGAMSLDGQGPFEGAVEVCRAVLARGGVNVIVTHRGAGSTRALLGHHRLESLFSAIVSADDGFPKKPDPAAFRAVMRQASLEPASTLAIGDRGIDILAGRAVGLYTVLFGGARAEVEPDLGISFYEKLIPALASRGLW
jgi:phosphoglycolate phosphatase-like HAD superfamily hydrolase